MSDVSAPGAKYCPQCGTPVDRAVAVAISGTIDEKHLGAYESTTGHAVVEDGEIRLYQHENGTGGER